MNQEIVNYNLKEISTLNEAFNNTFKSVIQIEGRYLNWKGDESFSVFVAYDNYPNTEFCMSYEKLVTYKNDEILNHVDIDLFLHAALKINDRETARRLEAHRRVNS